MLSTGDSLGPFVVVRQLGEGGMGKTYLCSRPNIEQRVCLKVIRPELRGQPETTELFQREALLSASLRHPCIAGVVAVDEALGFIAYEYIDGCDLRRLLSKRLLTPELTVYVLSQVCRALEYAHQRRLGGATSPVVHRDISPGNLMVDRWGNVKLIDFGVAKALAEGPSRFLSIKGKLPYMSPEQATSGVIDGRSDQYSLGVVAYEMLVGERPHDGRDERETLAKLLTSRHTPIATRLPDLAQGLAQAVERMLAVEPDARFPSMAEVFDALADFAPPATAYRELAARVRETAEPPTLPSNAGGGVALEPSRERPALAASERAAVCASVVQVAGIASSERKVAGHTEVKGYASIDACVEGPLTHSALSTPVPDAALAATALASAQPVPSPRTPRPRRVLSYSALALGLLIGGLSLSQAGPAKVASEGAPSQSSREVFPVASERRLESAAAVIPGGEAKRASAGSELPAAKSDDTSTAEQVFAAGSVPEGRPSQSEPPGEHPRTANPVADKTDIGADRRAPRAAELRRLANAEATRGQLKRRASKQNLAPEPPLGKTEGDETLVRDESARAPLPVPSRTAAVLSTRQFYPDAPRAAPGKLRRR